MGDNLEPNGLSRVCSVFKNLNIPPKRGITLRNTHDRPASCAARLLQINLLNVTALRRPIAGR
jgi:hypothetical protein